LKPQPATQKAKPVKPQIEDGDYEFLIVE